MDLDKLENADDKIKMSDVSESSNTEFYEHESTSIDIYDNSVPHTEMIDIYRSKETMEIENFKFPEKYYDLKNNDNSLLSTEDRIYLKRMDHTPINQVTWDGERGNSKCKILSDDYNNIYGDRTKYEDAAFWLKRFGVDGIEYQDGIPDFSPASVDQTKLDSFTSDRNKNFREARDNISKELIIQDNNDNYFCTDDTGELYEKNKTFRSIVEKQRWYYHEIYNDFVKHEDERNTVQFIPRSVHEVFTHAGAISALNECQKN